MENKDIKFQKAYLLIHVIEKYLERYPTGGNLHIVLDDGNFGADSVKFCLEYAKQHNDYWGQVIALHFLDFSEDEIQQIVDRPWEIMSQL